MRFYLIVGGLRVFSEGIRIILNDFANYLFEGNIVIGDSIMCGKYLKDHFG
jgi:hypothetical protein